MPLFLALISSIYSRSNCGCRIVIIALDCQVRGCVPTLLSLLGQEDVLSFLHVFSLHDTAEKCMFKSIVSNLDQVQHHALPRVETTCYKLCPCVHNFELL